MLKPIAEAVTSIARSHDRDNRRQAEDGADAAAAACPKACLLVKKRPPASMGMRRSSLKLMTTSCLSGASDHLPILMGLRAAYENEAARYIVKHSDMKRNR